jgi:hypothetical protein
MTAHTPSEELPNNAMAERVAKLIAARLRESRPHLRGRNFAIIVINQDGDRLYRVPIDLPYYVLINIHGSSV